MLIHNSTHDVTNDHEYNPTVAVVLDSHQKELRTAVEDVERWIDNTAKLESDFGQVLGSSPEAEKLRSEQSGATKAAKSALSTIENQAEIAIERGESPESVLHTARPVLEALKTELLEVSEAFYTAINDTSTEIVAAADQMATSHHKLQDIAIAARQTELAELVIDQVVMQSLRETYNQFTNILVNVNESGSDEPRQVQVQAQYYIARPNQANIEAARTQENFETIVAALRQPSDALEASLANGNTTPYRVGRAVEVGKASPNDIRQFVEEAIAQGIIHDYAVNRAPQANRIDPNQQLADLDDTQLQDLIQQWMRRVAVGVDCSGFVQQAAIQAREAERVSALAFLESIGRPHDLTAPVAIGNVERSASSFANEPEIEQPTDLRSGDIWVTANRGHVRVVTDVRIQNNHVELNTIESAGDVNQPDPGPVLRTWRTHSLTDINPLLRVDNNQPISSGQTFHRIPRQN